MTKELFKDDIILAMSTVISKEQLSILRDVLTVRLKDVEFENNTELMTIDNTNEYLERLISLKMFRIWILQ